MISDTRWKLEARAWNYLIAARKAKLFGRPQEDVRMYAQLARRYMHKAVREGREAQP